MAKGNPIPSLKITVGTSEVPAEAYADLLDVRVEEDIDAPAMFALRFLSWDAKKLALSWVDDSRFAPATPVVIELGYVGKLAEVMSGEITGVELDLAPAEPPILTVRGYDKSHRMTRATRTRTFANKSDSEIAEQIARENGLTPRAESTRVKHPFVAQYNQTDLRFLRARAALIEHEVVVEKDTLHFRKRQDSGAPALALSAIDDLLELSVRLTTRDLVDALEVHAWDQKKKEPVVGKATSSQQSPMGGTVGPGQAQKAFGAATAMEVDLPVSTKEEADQAARASLDRQARGFVTGDGECFGRTDIRAGLSAKIEGLGVRFTGIYDVVGAVHTYSLKQGYRTRFSLRRNSA